MFPAFAAIFKFMRRNICPVLLGGVLYVFLIITLWLIEFGRFSEGMVDFSIFVTSALDIGPRGSIFTILNFPFVFPPWDIPIPICCGGIYYILLFIAISKMIRQRAFRHDCRKKTAWRNLLFQRPVWIGGLIHVLLSAIIPISNFTFFIIAIPVISCMVAFRGVWASSCDKYWILALYFSTALGQGIYYGYWYMRYRDGFREKSDKAHLDDTLHHE